LTPLQFISQCRAVWGTPLYVIFLDFDFSIQLLNNKFYGLSPFGGHHSLLFDQEFQKMAGWE
jgi:hypothetical protein